MVLKTTLIKVISIIVLVAAHENENAFSTSTESYSDRDVNVNICCIDNRVVSLLLPPGTDWTPLDSVSCFFEKLFVYPCGSIACPS